jgi:hypothetical protein
MSARHRAPFHVAFALGMLMAVGACGGSEALGGSVGEHYDLEFETVRARLYPTELSIEYVRENGEVNVRLTVRVTDVNLSGPATVDLPTYGDLSGTSGGYALPAMESGTLVLEAYAPEAGAEVAGRFEAEVQGTRTTLTLHGRFETTLDVVQ